jgi:hypothetical protein
MLTSRHVLPMIAVAAGTLGMRGTVHVPRRPLLAYQYQGVAARRDFASSRLIHVRGGFTPSPQWLEGLKAVDPSVIKASFGAVGELLVACAIGVAATYAGVLDSKVVAALSKVVYNILLPSLLVANVAKTVYSRPLVSTQFLPACKAAPASDP